MILFSYRYAAAAAKSLQSCPTLCDHIDGSPPGSPIPGILQLRTLEWVAISFSNAGKWKVKVKSLSRARLLVTPWTAAHQDPLPMGFSRQEYWSGVPLPSPVEVSWLDHRKEGFPWWLSGKESTCHCRRHEFDCWVRKSPWRRKWQHTLVFLPGKSHGQGAWQATIYGISKQSDTDERLNNSYLSTSVTRRCCFPLASESFNMLFPLPGTQFLKANEMPTVGIWIIVVINVMCHLDWAKGCPDN